MKNLDEALITIGEDAYESAKVAALADGKTADETQVIAALARLEAMKTEITRRRNP